MFGKLLKLAKDAGIADPLGGWRIDVVAPFGWLREIPWWNSSYHGFISRDVSAFGLESAPTIQRDGKFVVVSSDGDRTYACSGSKSEHSPNGHGYPVSVGLLRHYPESPLRVGRFGSSSELLDFFKKEANAG